MELEISSPTQFELDTMCQQSVTLFLKSPSSFTRNRTLPNHSSAQTTQVRIAGMLRESKIAGARAGTKYRYSQLSNLLSSVEVQSILDRAFSFQSLSRDAKIVLPVITEVNGSMDISTDRQSAKTTKQSWRIIAPARITTTLLTWRQYLNIDLYMTRSTPKLNGYFAPQNRKETRLFKAAFCSGFAVGHAQANDMLSLQLNRLKRDFIGMWRFRQLEMQGIVTYPQVVETRLGTLVNDDVVFIDKRDVRIDVPTRFTESLNWRNR